MDDRSSIGMHSIGDAMGRHAQDIDSLWNVMLWVCGAMYLLVIGFMLLAMFRRGRRRDINDHTAAHEERGLSLSLATWTGLIVAGLFGLTLFSYFTDRSLVQAAADPKIAIKITGHQWWWEIVYTDPNDPSRQLRTANELHLPVGTPVKIYYRSSYVFVTRADQQLRLEGFDDERLKTLRIGVQMIGDDFSNTPPAHALARRGIVQNVRGYMVYGDYATDSPPRAIIDAVAKSEIDVAVVWGPLAGYFAKKSSSALALQPVAPLIDGPMLPMTFDISMGVRKEDRALRRELDDALERRRDDVQQILKDYGVPLLADE